MRLHHLVLDDWRGFTHLDLPFEPDLTLLVGDNGSGKSAVLDAVARALARGLGDTIGAPPHHVIRAGAARARAALEVRHGEEVRTLALEVAAGASNAETGDPWLHGRLPGPGQRRPVAVYYPADRWARDLTPADGAEGATDNYPLARPDDPSHRLSFPDLFEWLRRREDFENERLRDAPDYRDPALDAVRSVFSSLLPDVGRPRVRRTLDPQGRPKLSVQKGGVTLPFDALSDGERNLLTLGADVARRLADENPVEPLAGEGVVLIDEVDQHLHPRLQRAVVGRLLATFPNVQWILSSHSPLVAMHVETRCVRVLESFRLKGSPETRGRSANSLLVDLFGVPYEPDETAEQLSRIAALIDDERIEDARSLLDELATRLGEDDTAVIRNRTLLELLAVAP